MNLIVNKLLDVQLTKPKFKEEKEIETETTLEETTMGLWDCMTTLSIRGNLGSKMGLIRKHANNQFCELEFRNQYNFNKMSQP